MLGGQGSEHSNSKAQSGAQSGTTTAGSAGVGELQTPRPAPTRKKAAPRCMQRLYPEELVTDEPAQKSSEQVGPARNCKQQQGDQFIQGLSRALTGTAAANDNAVTIRARDMQRVSVYNTQMRVYLQEHKEVMELISSSCSSSSSSVHMLLSITLSVVHCLAYCLCQ